MTIEQIKQQVQSLLDEVQSIKDKHEPELKRIRDEITKLEDSNFEKIEKICIANGLNCWPDYQNGAIRIDWHEWMKPSQPLTN